jgi:hypothetical protein
MGDHYYSRTGSPEYDCSGIAEARKKKLVPSSTTVIKFAHPSPGLDFYIGNSLITAAGDNPRKKFPSLSDYEYRGMVREMAGQHARDAAALGTLYHDCIEAIVNDWGMPEGYLDLPDEFFPGFREWWDNSGLCCLETETSFASNAGYGGKIDLIAEDGPGGPVVYVDWKTQGTKPGEKARFYDSWPLQLESYARGDQAHGGYDYPEYSLLSVVISTTEPGRIETKLWDDNDAYWEQFLRCLGAWQYCKKYNSGWEE